jgi:UDP-N-acetylmuramoyl-tripeptide--D-alanyl-D-alanine ligase
LPKHGTAILNADDSYVRAMAARTKARVVTFGQSPEADIRATSITSAWPDRLALTVSHGDESLHIQTSLIGEHHTVSVLAAIACGAVCGIDLRTCAEAIEKQQPIFGRLSVHEKPGGPVFILDSVKAPLWTMAAGLTFVEQARAPRKTIVIGTISDYPGARGQTYRRLARQALKIAHRVVFVGPNAGHVTKLQQGEAKDRLFSFESSRRASRLLTRDSQAGELIYVKGSRTVDHLERIMLSQLDRVVCWRRKCGVKKNCPECKQYRKRSAP